MISMVLFVLNPVQQPALVLLSASVDLILRLYVYFMAFRGYRVFKFVNVNIYCLVSL